MFHRLIAVLMSLGAMLVVSAAATQAAPLSGHTARAVQIAPGEAVVQQVGHRRHWRHRHGYGVRYVYVPRYYNSYGYRPYYRYSSYDYPSYGYGYRGYSRHHDYGYGRAYYPHYYRHARRPHFGIHIRF